MDLLTAADFAPLLFLPTFPILWCGVCWLLAQLGGWAALAPRYATHLTPRGTPFRWQDARFGWVSYNNVLQIDVAREGLFLSLPWLFRLGHPPLLLPWHAIHDVSTQRFLWLRVVRFGVEQPPLARISLPAKVFEATAEGRAALAGTAPATAVH